MADNDFNEQREYMRIKELIHTVPICEEKRLMRRIEEFGTLCSDRRLYKSLKWKFRWHRKIHPKRFPFGELDVTWANQTTPLVSVIVPNYAHSPYLKERIDCILNQTFQNFELILLDDCSPDNSQEILLSYKDHPKVSHIIINEKNTGNTFLQWEKGVNIARGKYIWIAESDDYADETFLECVMFAFFQNEDCALVRTGSYQVNSKGRILLRDWDLWKEDCAIHYYKGHQYIVGKMLHFNYIYNASMVVFRKDVFQQIDKSYQKLRYTGDWQCWIEFLQKGAVCEYRRKLNYFRQHENKVSVRSERSYRGFIDQVNVMAYTVKNLKMSAFRKSMIRGEQYEIIMRVLVFVDEGKEDFLDALYKNLGASKLDYRLYKLVSFFEFLPFVHAVRMKN